MRIFNIRIFCLFLFFSIQSISHAAAPREDLLNKFVFDIDYYLARNSDLAIHFQGNKSQATEHWVSNGFYEGRRGSPFFSITNYMFYNPDLANAFGPFHELYLNHFLKNGLAEGRTSSVFYSGRFYLSTYPDLQAAFGHDYRRAFEHFIDSGLREGRQASPYFNTIEYLSANPDLGTAFGLDFTAAMVHWGVYGSSENRPLGNVQLRPTTGGSPFSRTLTGSWRSPQLPGFRFNLTQTDNSYNLKLCQAPSNCFYYGGATGVLDFKQKSVLIGHLTPDGPQVQFTVQFTSPTSGDLTVDACFPTSLMRCAAGAGQRFEIVKE